MYCKACGKLSADGTVTCSKCGAVLAVDFDIAPIVAPDGASTPSQATEAVARGQAAVERFADEWPEEWDFDEEMWRRAIGPHNTDFYLLHFQSLHNGEKRKFRWHWPAFFITFFWLLHRRMWFWAALYGAYASLTLLWMAILLNRANFDVLKVYDHIIGPLALQFILPPMYATFYYYHALKGSIASEKNKYKSRAVVLRRVEQRGGTGRAGVIGAALVFVGVVLFTILLGVGSWKFRANRTKTRLAVTAAMKVAQRVNGYVQRTQHLPKDIRPFSTGAGIQEHISRIELDPTSGVITFEISFGHGAPDGNILFQPNATDWTWPYVVWTCVPDDRMRLYAPQECRS
jgi:hypothetical protein